MIPDGVLWPRGQPYCSALAPGGSAPDDRLTSRSVTDTSNAPTPDVHDVPGTSCTSDEVDLDVVERDLAAVERALDRLSDGTYWTDEVTGEPIPESVLADDPTARRA